MIFTFQKSTLFSFPSPDLTLAFCFDPLAGRHVLHRPGIGRVD
jgi:hypothetical protein